MFHKHVLKVIFKVLIVLSYPFSWVVLCVANCCLCFEMLSQLSRNLHCFSASGAEQSRNCQHFCLIGSFTEKPPAQPAAEMEGVAANLTCILQIKNHVKNLFK